MIHVVTLTPPKPRPPAMHSILAGENPATNHQHTDSMVLLYSTIATLSASFTGAFKRCCITIPLAGIIMQASEIGEGVGMRPGWIA